MRHGERATGLAVLAQDEFSRRDRALLTGQGVDPAPVDQRLRNAVAKAEGVLCVLVGTETVRTDQRDAGGFFQFGLGLCQHVVERIVVARINGQCDMASAGAIGILPCFGRVFAEIAQLLGTSGHALLEGQRKTRQRGLGQPECLQAVIADGDAGPRIQFVRPTRCSRNMVGQTA